MSSNSRIRVVAAVVNIIMTAGMFSFYLTETILFYEDVKPAFPLNVSNTTQFFLGSTEATAICGTITWGLIFITTLTSRIRFCGDEVLIVVACFGFIAMFILLIINMVVTGMWDYGHMSEVSKYAPSYFFTLYIFNIVFGLLGNVTVYVHEW